MNQCLRLGREKFEYIEGTAVVTCQICKKEHSANQEDANFHHMVDNMAIEFRELAKTETDSDFIANLDSVASILEHDSIVYKSGSYEHQNANIDVNNVLQWVLKTRTLLYDANIPAPRWTEILEHMHELNALANPTDISTLHFVRSEINKFRSADERLSESLATNVGEPIVESTIRSLEEPYKSYKTYDNLYEAREKEGIEGFEQPDVVPALPPLTPPPAPYKAKPLRKSRKSKAKRPQKDDITGEEP